MLEKQTLRKYWPWLVGIAILGVVGWLSNAKDMSFDFIIPLTALATSVFAIHSWVQKNRTLAKNDSARLSDARREKLADLAAEIIEKTHEVDRAIKVVVNGVTFRGEIEKARKKYGIQERDKYDKNGIVFRYRYEEMEKFFIPYWGLDIKARIYFGDEAERAIQDLKSIIHSVSINILIINDSPVGSTGEESPLATRSKEYLWALCLGRFQLEYPEGGPAKEQVDKFKSIPDRIEKALLKYIREEQTTTGK